MLGVAKGQEWDNVQVCDDFIKLKVDLPGPKCPSIHCQRTNKMRKLFQFAAKSYGDDLNLLYVACTRSKNVLSVPPHLKSLITNSDDLWHWTMQFEGRVKRKELEIEKGVRKDSADGKYDNAGIAKFSDISNPDIETVYQIYDDIVHEMRRETGVENTALIPIFFNGDDTDRIAI